MKNLRDSYELYKKLYKNPIDKKQYLALAAEYNKFLMSKVLAGKEVTLPSRMGTLSVVGRVSKVRLDEDGNIIGLAPDWVKTKELWENNPQAKLEKKRIFHTNAHTDNVRYKFLWSKKNVLVENKTLYSLRMTRTNKRAVHKSILEGAQFKTQ